jgi:type I restriction enzyme S subunit
MRLADVADIRFSNVDKKSIPGEPHVRLCNYMDVYANDYIAADIPFMEATASHAEIERFRVEEGDVMLTKDSESPEDIGIPAVVIEDIPALVCGYHLALIKPRKDKIDPFYLAKQLGSKQTATYFSRLANGSTRYGLSSSAIANTAIPLAPLSQQRRIAEILSTLDEAIEQTEALIAKMQQVKTGLMHDLFTRGVTPDGRLRPTREQAPELYKESPLGWIPKEWEVDCFGSRVSIVDPNPSHRYPEPAFTGIPICSTENFSGEDDYDLDNSKLMPESVFTLQSSRCGFSPLDIIFARKGRIGLARRYGLEKKVFSHTVVVFKPASDLVSYEWLLWLSRSQWLFGGIERKMNSNSGVPTLGISFIQDLTVPFPPPEEQALISKGLDDIAHLISAEIENASKQRKKKYGLMHDLLGGVVAVS